MLEALRVTTAFGFLVPGECRVGGKSEFRDLVWVGGGIYAAPTGFDATRAGACHGAARNAPGERQLRIEN